MSNTFIRGLELAELFYNEAVKPLLADLNLVYSAALIGEGSDVLGFDTPQSIDHGWGPRLMLFLAEADYETRREAIDRRLRRDLRGEIRGYPTNYAHHDDGTTVMAAVDGGPINHGVVLLTVRGYFRATLNFDPTAEIRAVDWVSVPGHRLRMLTSGRVFHDGLGQLEPVRDRLRYYPRDVWLYLLAAQWRRIAQEEAFMGRCGQVGDELGSRLIAARQVRDLVYLCFLMNRRYPPYVKWLGTAFAQLDGARELEPLFTAALQANSWEERQAHLAKAYEFVAQMHNALHLTAPLRAQVSPFWKRPFLVIHGGRFVGAIRATIESEEVRALPEHLGCVDQFVDSTDAWAYVDRFRQVFSSPDAA